MSYTMHLSIGIWLFVVCCMHWKDVYLDSQVLSCNVKYTSTQELRPEGLRHGPSGILCHNRDGLRSQMPEVAERMPEFKK